MAGSSKYDDWLAESSASDFTSFTKIPPSPYIPPPRRPSNARPNSTPRASQYEGAKDHVAEKSAPSSDSQKGKKPGGAWGRLEGSRHQHQSSEDDDYYLRAIKPSTNRMTGFAGNVGINEGTRRYPQSSLGGRREGFPQSAKASTRRGDPFCRPAPLRSRLETSNNVQPYPHLSRSRSHRDNDFADLSGQDHDLANRILAGVLPISLPRSLVSSGAERGSNTQLAGRDNGSTDDQEVPSKSSEISKIGGITKRKRNTVDLNDGVNATIESTDAEIAAEFTDEEDDDLSEGEEIEVREEGADEGLADMSISANSGIDPTLLLANHKLLSFTRQVTQLQIAHQNYLNWKDRSRRLGHQLEAEQHVSTLNRQLIWNLQAEIISIQVEKEESENGNSKLALHNKVLERQIQENKEAQEIQENQMRKEIETLTMEKNTANEQRWSAERASAGMREMGIRLESDFVSLRDITTEEKSVLEGERDEARKAMEVEKGKAEIAEMAKSEAEKKLASIREAHDIERGMYVGKIKKLQQDASVREKKIKLEVDV